MSVKNNLITNDIKNNTYHQIYVIYGNEAYLRRFYKKALLSALVKENDNMNFTRFTQDDASVDKLIDIAETMPFFAERRVILCENCGFFSRSEEKLSDYLKEVSESTVIIFIEESLDKRTKTYKAVKDTAALMEVNMPEEKELTLWCLGHFKKAGKRIATNAWNEFYLRTSSSMDMMDVEMEKLISYVGDRDEITIEDVKNICIGQIEEKVFEMIQALSSGNTEKVMEFYRGILLSKDEPFRILYLLEKQFKQLLTVKDMYENHYSNDSIAKATGIPSYYVRKNLDASRNLTSESILSFLNTASELEGKAKSGLISPQNAVETLLFGGL